MKVDQCDINVKAMLTHRPMTDPLFSWHVGFCLASCYAPHSTSQTAFLGKILSAIGCPVVRPCKTPYIICRRLLMSVGACWRRRVAPMLCRLSNFEASSCCQLWSHHQYNHHKGFMIKIWLPNSRVQSRLPLQTRLGPPMVPGFYQDICTQE